MKSPPSNIPQYLITHAGFCVWQYEKVKGRITKVPYNPITGQNAEVNAPQTFVDYEAAIAAAEKYNGIGIRVADKIACIDLDHCIEDGKIQLWAQQIIDRFKSTYIEISPSGTGIHIFCLIPNGFIYDKTVYFIKKGDIEVYIPGHTNRFLTMTGNSIGAADLAEEGESLTWVLDTYMLRPKPIKPVQAVEAVSYLSDDSVMEKASAAKNSEKFKRLWNGDITGFPSHSEADAALCSMLAFWCGGDTDQMDRLFRQSGLMRDKWERDDYRTWTLTKAVSACTEFYKPITVSTASEDFNDILTVLGELNITGNNRYRSGDIGYGRLFADVYKSIARYVPERKKWYVYDGKRWTADIAGLNVMELCKNLADALLVYALSITEESVRTHYINECKRWQQRRYREIYLKEAQSVYPIPMEEFDRNGYLFNCSNGTLDLRDNTFHEHLPEDLLTKISPVEYNPEAKSLRFERFIDEIMSNDYEKAKFLQKALGYGICGDTRHECLFFLYGELTRNGKGTLMESCLSVVGDYGKAVRPETIAQKQFSNSQAPSEDIARLAGIRFANISEPSKGLVLNAAQVKSMTGNDTLNARYLNENSFDFKPQFKLYINTNYLPVISDMTLFSSGRVIIIPFNRHFEEWEQDKTLKEEFAKPHTQSAILNWMVEGYQMLCEEGFGQPETVVEATQAYSHESDKIAQFAEDRLIADNTGEERTAAVYDAYRTWCSDNGCYAENNRNFNHELRKFAVIERKRPQNGGEKTTMLIGYKLKDRIEPLFE